jgi:hypothetical protein
MAFGCLSLPRRRYLGVARERRVRAELARLANPEEPFEIDPPGYRKELEALSAQFLPDVVTFDFVFKNDGELTIRAPAVELREIRNERLFDGVIKSVPMRRTLEDAIIYPGDEQTIEDARFSLECKRETVFASGDYTLNWKVFLDNSPPNFGEIDLASLIETARKQSVRVSE